MTKIFLVEDPVLSGANLRSQVPDFLTKHSVSFTLCNTPEDVDAIGIFIFANFFPGLHSDKKRSYVNSIKNEYERITTKVGSYGREYEGWGRNFMSFKDSCVLVLPDPASIAYLFIDTGVIADIDGYRAILSDIEYKFSSICRGQPNLFEILNGRFGISPRPCAMTRAGTVDLDPNFSSTARKAIETTEYYQRLDELTHLLVRTVDVARGDNGTLTLVMKAQLIATLDVLLCELKAPYVEPSELNAKASRIRDVGEKVKDVAINKGLGEMLVEVARRVVEFVAHFF